MSSFLKGSIASEWIDQSVKFEPTHLAFFVNLFSKVLFNGLFFFFFKNFSNYSMLCIHNTCFFKVITPLSLKLHINHLFDFVLGLIPLFGKCKLFAKFLSMNCLFLFQFFFHNYCMSCIFTCFFKVIVPLAFKNIINHFLYLIIFIII